jgi:hypothetical protein
MRTRERAVSQSERMGWFERLPGSASRHIYGSSATLHSRGMNAVSLCICIGGLNG